jgi:2'-5' RNA ligase
MALLRLFIGLDLPENIKDKLGAIEEELKKFVSSGKWVRRENLHLTLKFLGYCEEDKVEAISQKIKEVAQIRQTFDFRLRNLGAFPSIKRARVLWVGINEGAREFQALQEEIDKAVTDLGFPPEERQFHPHITVARLKIPRRLDENRLQNLSSQIPDETLKARSIILFQSKLTPKGAEYSTVTENFLKSA